MSAEATTLSNSRFSSVERVLAAGGIFVFLAGAFYVWFFEPTTEGIFPKCPLLSMTGLACPGCGLTRAFHALFHGDIIAAFDFDLMFPFYAFALFYVFLGMFKIALGGERGMPTSYFKPKLLGTFVVLALIFAVLRNPPFYPFNILYP